MSSPRKKTGWPIVAALLAVLVLAPLGCYVGGYYATGEKLETPSRSFYRIYRTRWQARIFWPAAKVESALTGETIVTVIEVPGSEDVHSFMFP